MTKDPEMDPLEVLRAANPVDTDRLSSASLARIRARVSEDVMTATARPRRPPWSAGAVALVGGALAAGAIALAVLVGQPGSAPGVIPGSSDGTGSAFCVEQYGPTTLAHRDFAFDGTVSAIDGEQVTFAINRPFRGVQAASIVLNAPGMSGTTVTSAGGPNLAVGERYLVAGDETYVWACGYTQPYDPKIAAEWEAALGG